MTIETVLHATLTKSRKKLMLASVKSNALMAWAFAQKRVEFENGGYEITNPLTVGRNPNVTSYEYYDSLPTAQTSEFDTVTYTWSRVAGTVIISDQEQDENRGDSMIFKLLTAKMDVLEESIKEQFSSYLYSTPTGTDPNGLPFLVPSDPTTGSPGGINRATVTQWRTSAYDFSGSLDETNIEEAIDDIMMDLTLKGEKPSVIIMGRNLYRFYRAAVRDKTVISLGQSGFSGSAMVDLGFSGVKHDNVPILYDEDCPVNVMWVLNDKYIKVHILRHANMKIKTLNAPWDTDAVGRRVVWQGQFCLWNSYRKHAYVTN